MTEKKRRLFLAIFTVILVLAAVTAESAYHSDYENKFRTRRFNKILREKEKTMEECLNELKLLLARGEPRGSVSEEKVFKIAEQNGITILQYIDRKLIHWSDNNFNVPTLIQDDSLFSKPLIFLQNGWFLPRAIEAGNEKIIGLLRIRTDYGFENDIVRNGFGSDFGIMPDVGFSTDRNDSGYNVFNSSGAFLFSLSFPEIRSKNPVINIPLILWGLVLVCILLLSLEAVKILTAKGMNAPGVIACFVIFASIYIFVLIAREPAVLFRTGFFSPYIFSFSGFIPSLGHLLLISVLAAVFSYIFYKDFPIRELTEESSSTAYLVLSSLLVTGAILICLLHIVFSKLVSDSNINFETYKVLKLSIYSVTGFVSVILLLLVPVFIIFKTFRTGRQTGTRTLILPVLTSFLVFPVFLYHDPLSLLALLFLWSGLLLLVWITGQRKTGKLNLSVIFSLILGVYSLYVITVFSEKKTNENLKVEALSFSTDNDPEAEHLLLDIWPRMTGDTTLGKMMTAELFYPGDFNRISGYLNEKYFNGYWDNFNISVYPCRKGQSIRVEPGDNNFEDCFGFFEERIRKYGHPLTGTEFYFIDNQRGRSFYLGRLFYTNRKNITNGLFIELYGDINVFQPGYSELLLDKKFHRYSGLKDYSFAKYINGEIVLNYGEFPYKKADDEYIDENSDYRIFNDEGFRHILYRNGNATVLISRPVLNTGNIIISFAYLFTFIFIFSNLLLILILHPEVKRVISLNFRQKLQLSFTGILLFSFILIGVVVAYLTVRDYKSRHDENIKEKLNSIYIELENEISSERHLTANWRNSNYASLNELLINLSNIFNTDINLYDLNGFLMATSRPEIFLRDLTSRRMNMIAFMNVADLTKSEFIQTETVGTMKYISAYVPFYNNEKHVLAYLNLPYFRMQSLLAREISNLVVAVINFTLLLIVITMSLAVFISGRLTLPLSVLSGRLASVRLGKKSEHLSYKGNDEIGELVKQYNRMVDELEESAHKLANSEREYAWREMAKQIAHEIKNPLTPMKLNVQQLLKSWKDGIPGFEEKLEGFSRNQIEYIDNLSNIASAFSSFAKMPGTNPVEVDLLEQIKTTLELFRSTDNISFEVRWPSERKVYIYADKEHLNGIFSNLLKNSIQAIPAGRKGLIKVALEVVRNKAVVSVSDNGTGISEALKKKMFTPNFTTKSSGTGLGLSIVKKYVEGANGSVWFESESNKGTTFHVEFPLIFTVEKPGEALTNMH